MNYRRLLFFLIAFGVFAFFGITDVMASDYGLTDTAQSAGLSTYGKNLPQLVGNVIGTLLSMISILFFVLVLYGGIMYMTARGDSGKMEKAISTIIGATIGIIIVMGAYALTNFVFGVARGNPPPATSCIARGESVCGSYSTSEECTQSGTDAAPLGARFGCTWEAQGQGGSCVVGTEVKAQCQGLSSTECTSASNQMRCQLIGQ